MEELIMSLAQLSPVVAILIWVIIHFKGEIVKKDEEIHKLNEQLRAADKENLTVLAKTVAFFEKITDRLDNLNK